MGRVVLNIKTSIIHNADNPCYHLKRVKEQNKKYFDSIDGALNFFEGGKKAEKCGVCCWNE